LFTEVLERYAPGDGQQRLVRLAGEGRWETVLRRYYTNA